MRPAIQRIVHRRRLVALWLATVIVLVPLTVFATHEFGDVPDDSIFHDDISAMADAGITLGCGGGNYCPEGVVTREQMAGFLNRGLARTALGGGSRSMWDLTNGVQYVTEVEIVTGGAAGGSGFVVVDADVTAYTTAAGTCPCLVGISIEHFDGPPYSGALVGTSSAVWFEISDTEVPFPVYHSASAGSVSWVFEVPTAATQGFAVQVGLWTETAIPPAGAEEQGQVDAMITATYVPYGDVSQAVSP